MGILGWLKRVTQSGQEHLLHREPLTFAAGEEEFHGLNMKEALDAHLAWTRRIEDHLRGSSTSSHDVHRVSADNECVLGRWIHGPARERFATRTEYDYLRDTHAAFHREVGKVLANIQAGSVTDTTAALRTVRRSSSDVQLALITLYASAGGATLH